MIWTWCESGADDLNGPNNRQLDLCDAFSRNTSGALSLVAATAYTFSPTSRCSCRVLTAGVCVDLTRSLDDAYGGDTST